MATRVVARIPYDMLGGRKECHERSMVREVRELSRITPEYATRYRIFARLCAIDVARGDRRFGPRVNLSLRMLWRQASNFAKQSGLHA